MTALDALKRACVEVQASRPYPRKRHRTLALWTCGSFDCNRRAAGMLRFGCRHDASLKQAGAQSSLSPVDAEDEPVMEPSSPVRFRLTVQYCSHSQNRIANYHSSPLLDGTKSCARPNEVGRAQSFTSYAGGGGVPGEKSVAVCADTNAHTGSPETDTAPVLVTAALDITLTTVISV
jgi:hypothetical protein